MSRLASVAKQTGLTPITALADGADKYPHNMKVYNLCRIKKIGLDRWVEEEAGQIRKK
jgi:hypothetical protein